MRSYLGTSNINNIAPWVHGAHTLNQDQMIDEQEFNNNCNGNMMKGNGRGNGRGNGQGFRQNNSL
jgi:hypothetical protein